MVASVIRFGRFRLDPLARELLEDGRRIGLPVSTIDCLLYLIDHRDRAVGRDELAAAVWGRADVSEVSINHAVMRLRRVLGDTGNEQHHIRTLPRLGYRWVADIDHETHPTPPSPPVAQRTVEADSSPETANPPLKAESSRRTASHRRTLSLAGWLASALMVAAIATVTASLWFVAKRTGNVSPTAAVPAAPIAAMVLPAIVDAPTDWSWLGLGFMDLVAHQAQSVGLPTLPSETVVALVKASPAGALDTRFDLAPLLLVTRATRVADTWIVRVEAREQSRSLEAEARDPDPILAARRASEDVLIKLGYTPKGHGGDASLAQETLQRRVNAAVLAGQLDVAKSVIEDAPEALRNSPEIALSQASIDFFAGHYDAGAKRVEALLPRLTGTASTPARARALNTLGAAYFRQDRIDEAEAAFAQALDLLDAESDPGLRARAHIGLGGVASHHLRVDDAAVHFGQARTLHEMRGDAFGVAAVDLNLGLIALQRGQPAAALPMLTDAADRFERLGSADALAATRVAMVDAELQLLEPARALALTERFVSMAARDSNQRQHWELRLAHARALAANGELTRAEGQLNEIVDDSDPAQDAVVRLQTLGVRARIALLRGDPARAAELAKSALSPELASRNRRDYGQVWLARIRALQGGGQLELSADEITTMREWSAGDPTGGDAIAVALAHAGQADAEGRNDVAVTRYADALDLATRRAVPDDIVATGELYARALLDAGRVPEAASVSGRIASWARRDPRAAWTQARVYQAMAQPAAAAEALAHARRLARERPLPERP